MNFKNFPILKKMTTSNLRLFLKKHKDDDNMWANLVEMGEQKGKYSIASIDMDAFWDNYKKAINNNEILGLAEKPSEELPVLVDIDLKIESDLERELYTDEQLEQVVYAYQTVLRQIVDDCTDNVLICVVLQKNPYQKIKGNKVWLKHGFHLHFPYCFLNRTGQVAHLIPRVKAILKEKKVFDDIVEDSGDVIDDCTKKPWLLYGSMKDVEAQAYLVTKIYNASMDILTPSQAFSEYQLYDSKQKPIKMKNIEDYYPQILSITPNNRKVYELKKTLVSPLKESIKKERKNLPESIQRGIVEVLNEAKELLNIISSSRADKYDEWLKIGWILYNISEGTEDGFELWNEFSSRSSDYDEGSVIVNWQKMIKRDVPGLGTLKYLAKIDNEREYEEFKKKKIINIVVDMAKGGSHDDIARILYDEFSDQFVCASIENKSWFQYINHKWEYTETGVELRKKIMSYIHPLYEESRKALVRQKFEAELNSDGGKAAISGLSKRIENIQRVIDNLKNNTFQNSVIKTAMDKFYDKKFKVKLDSNRYLIAFQNGVYDFKENVFRNGNPEDYLSKALPINYVNFNEDSDKVIEVKKIFSQIFPDRDVYKYFFDMASEIFVGGNTQKVVLFWTGCGENGKSITQMFFDAMLGQLCVKLNTTVVTGAKTASGAANADLARTGGGVRLITMEESSPEEEINIGILKHLSGNDSFYARDLFERGKDVREISPMFKIFFVCNRLPILKNADQATYNRIRVIPFESVFCRIDSDNPPPDTEYEQLRQKRFPRDPTLGARIPELAEAFAWILIEHRKGVRNFNAPPKVMKATDDYKRKNDIYQYFINDKIVEEKDASITLEELYIAFKDWFGDNTPIKQIPKKLDVEEYFYRLWGEYANERKKKWTGYRIHTFAEDDYEESIDGCAFPKD